VCCCVFIFLSFLVVRFLSVCVSVFWVFCVCVFVCVCGCVCVGVCVGVGVCGWPLELVKVGAHSNVTPYCNTVS
jgi:hypothetical protein